MRPHPIRRAAQHPLLARTYAGAGALALTLVAPGCGWIGHGTGSLTSLVSTLVGGQPLSPTQAARAGTIAVGQELTTELATNLVAAGFTAPQAQVIAAGAGQEVVTSAGTIAVSALDLTDPQPIVYAAGAVVRGAVESLNLPGAGLTDAARRGAIAKIIMSSTFTSLHGRVGALAKEQLLGLHKAMVANAVQVLTAGGLGGTDAPAALLAVTSGAVSALGQSVGAGDAAEAAAQVVTGAVQNLNSAGLSAGLIGQMVGSAAQGAVGSLSLGGALDAAAGAGAIAKASITGLKNLALSPADLLLASAGAANGSVSGLAQNHVPVAQIAAAAQQVAAASVAALTAAGVSAGAVGGAAGAIASGAIQGLGNAGLSAAQIVSTNSVSSIVNGATGALSGQMPSANATADAAAAVASTALGAVAKTSLATATDSQRQSVLNDVMTGSAKGIKTNALSAAQSLTAMSRVSQSSVEALAGAGFSGAAAGQASALILADGITSSVAAGLATAADAGKLATAYGSAVGAGAVRGKVTVDAATLLAQVQAAATTVGATADATTIMSAAMSGTASGAALAGTAGTPNLVLASLQSSVTSGAAFAGLSSADKAALSGSTQQALDSAATLATSVNNGGLPACAAAFPDGLADPDFWAKVKPLPQPVICQGPGGACPALRTNGGVSATWLSLGATGDCQLEVTSTAKGSASAAALFVDCATLAAKPSIEDIKPFLNPNYNGVPCAKSPGTGCPALQADSSKEGVLAWHELTIATPGDACLLQDQGGSTGAGGGPAVACADAGVKDGFGSAELNAMGADPNNAQDHYCDVPSGACPLPAAALTQAGVNGPNQGPQGVGSRCFYYNNNPDCASLGLGVSPLSATALASVTSSGPFGDVNCAVQAGSCPALDASGTAEFHPYAEPIGGTPGQKCSYTRIYPDCAGRESGSLFASSLATFPVAANDPTQRVCNLTNTTFNSYLMGTLSTAGFTPGHASGYTNGTRFVVEAGTAACATFGITGTVSAAVLGKLPTLATLFSQACDVPYSTSCPVVDGTLPGVRFGSVDVAELNLTRCLYTSPIAACPGGPVTFDGLSGFSSVRTQQLRAYGCDPTPSSTCQLPDGSLSPFGYAAAAAPTPVAGTAYGVCRVTPSVAQCADAAQNGTVKYSGSLSPITGDVVGCDAPLAASCPTVAGDMAAYLPTATALGEFQRCGYRPPVVTCANAGASGGVTGVAIINNMTPLPWSNHQGSRACEANTCPPLGVAAYQTSSSDLNQNGGGAGVSLCEFYPTPT